MPPDLAEPMLALVTLAACASLTRLFDSSRFLPRLLVIAVLAHVLAAVTRRLRWPGWARFAVFAVGFGVMITVAYLPGTGLAGLIPTSDTVATARLLIDEGWTQFSSIKAPAPTLPGYLIIAATATWVTAWMSDWIAFRSWAAVEALMPSAAMLVFTAVLGTGAGRAVSGGAYAIAALGFVGLHRAGRDGANASWVGNRSVQGARALAAACLPVVVLAGAIGAVVGPALPGAHDPALTGWRHLGDPGDDRSLASPLVDLRKRLIAESNVELFTVKASRPAYWRLMSLEQFDGQEWRSSGSFGKASGDLPHTNRPGDRSRSIDQRFQIGATGAVWVPAAFEVTSVESSSGELRWDAGAAALISGKQRLSADGLSYHLVSAVPDPTAAQVAHADGSVPSAVRDRYLGLPSSLDRKVTTLARQVTAGRASPLQKARALEEWFRVSGGFTYSLNAPAGQNSNALLEFLFDSKTGYCQQFAASFAAMARTLGIPSRVAVGYTWGEVDPAGTYHVLGRNAHAWPELWFAGVGWLPFEPTPGRGIPDAGAWSTSPPAQQTGDPSAPPPPGSTAPAGPLADPTPSTAPTSVPGSGAVTASQPPAASATAAAPWWRSWLLAAVGIGALLVAWGLAVPALLRARRRRRRRSAHPDPSMRVILTWTESAEALGSTGLAPLPSESHAEFASRVRRVWPKAGSSGPARSPVPALLELSDLAAAARWSGHDTPALTAQRAEQLRDQIESAVGAHLGRWGRLRRSLDPRPLLSQRPVAPSRPAPVRTRTA